ncbi:hypothetical protein G7009_18090 [Pseudomonas capeferrum]|jgi:hypothetical protein|uniref:hypothetical protein n=1 Tax=Pseudomonas TaxID=286 RepID=UPI0015E475E9|nr:MULTISPECIES: hypothetical protein [Pseudomonas]MBA1203635.1 hypothetical protein [Pseudomonas capeferrum]
MTGFIAIKTSCTIPEKMHVQSVLKEQGLIGDRYPRIMEHVPRSVREHFEPLPLSHDALSVFSNEVETLSYRKAAADSLGQALEELPASKVQGPLRTARIKCKLAANFGKTHAEVNDRYCEVFHLLHEGGVNFDLTEVN